MDIDGIASNYYQTGYTNNKATKAEAGKSFAEMQIPDIFQCLIEFLLVGAAAAQFEIFIPCWLYHFCGNLQLL